MPEAEATMGTGGVGSLILDGCDSASLLGYLKALGIFRLLALQREAAIRMRWQVAVPVLETSLDRLAIEGFFLDEYQPTPFLAPWNGGSGFYRKGTADKALAQLERASAPRLAGYVQAIAAARAALQAAGVGSEIMPSKADETKRKAKAVEAKADIIRECRSALPEGALPALDAMVVLAGDKVLHGPILGSGGNDGNLEFGSNFVQRLIEVLPLAEGAARPNGSAAWLGEALFGGGSAPLQKAAIGQFSPRGVGGPNSGSKASVDSLVNPWDYVLLMEGCAVVVGAATRRLRAGARGTASFPFSVKVSPAGPGSMTHGEGESGRSELWLPVWRQAASYRETQHLFGEARAVVGGRQAASGVDLARAAASLGVDRGVGSFERFAFLGGQRSGRAHLGVGFGRLPVREEPAVGLLTQIDDWLGSLRRATRNGSPASAARAVRQMDDAILAYCKLGGSRRLQEILVGLGRLEHLLARGHRTDGGSHGDAREGLGATPPLQGLSAAKWLQAADDGTAEFGFAAALASVADPDLGPLRCQLEPVTRSRGRIAWAGAGVDQAAQDWPRKAVWGLGSLGVNLAAALERRCLEGKTRGITGMPMEGALAVRWRDVIAFLAGTLDEARVENLLWAMATFDWVQAGSRLTLRSTRGSGLEPDAAGQIENIPRAYALLKLLFLPTSKRKTIPGSDVAAARQAEGMSALTEVTSRHGQILSHLRAGNLARATELAMIRLRVAGLAPRGARTSRAPRFILPPPALERVAGVLLAPVSSGQAVELARLVLRSTEDAGDN
jgi:CRISPR-associated protein Csx17